MSRTASASIALSGAQLLAKMIDFVLVLVLARLLTPEDFALIAIAMIFVQLTEAVLEMPVSQVLVRTPRVTRDMLYTAFAVSLIRSGIVVAIILILTPISVIIFNEPRLYLLMPVLALAPAMRGLVNPKMALLARRLNFYPEAAINVISRATTAAIALPFAIVTESYWALVLMTVISPGLLMVMTYLYVPFRPRFSLKSWGIFANMVGWTTVAQFFSAAHWQVKVFILAQFAPRATTGNYSVASNLNGIVQHSIVEPLVRPFISTFSLLQKDGAIQQGYLISSRALLMAAGPIFVILAVLSDPIILFFFGSEWGEAPIFLTILSIWALLIVPVRPGSAVAYAQDRTIFVAWNNGIAFVSLTLLIWGGYAWFGLNGFLHGIWIGAIIQLVSSMWMVKRLTEIKYWTQIEVTLVPILALGVLALFLHQIAPVITASGQIALFFSIAAACIAGVLVYAAVILGAWLGLGKPDGIEKTILNALIKRNA